MCIIIVMNFIGYVNTAHWKCKLHNMLVKELRLDKHFAMLSVLWISISIYASIAINVYLLTYLLTHSLIHSLTLTLSLTHSHTHSITRLHSLTTHSFNHSLTHSLTRLHSLIFSLTHTHSLTHSLTLSHTLTHSLAYIHSLTHLLTHWLTRQGWCTYSVRTWECRPEFFEGGVFKDPWLDEANVQCDEVTRWRM